NKPKLPCPYCFSLNTSNNGTGKNLNDPRTYCNTCKWSYSTQIAENFAYAFQNKKGKINESVNSNIGVTKKTSDPDINKVLNSSPEEKFTNLNQSKLTKEQIALVISGESSFPITKYIFVYFTGIKRGLSVKKIEIINCVFLDNKLDILALAETWRDDIDNLNTNYWIAARLLSKQVKKRYSNSEDILILAQKSIYPQIIPSITDFGICIKINDTLLIFIYKLPAGFDVLALGDYNLKNSVAYEQIVLEQHAELGLYETKLAPFTYKHGSKTSTPDKCFSNFNVSPVVIEIEGINHKLIKVQVGRVAAQLETNYNINLLKNAGTLREVRKRIETLTIKNEYFLNTLSIDEKLNLLHKILLKAARTLQIRKHVQRVSHNPILSHLKRLRKRKSANKDAQSVQLLRKEIRRLSRKLKRLGVEEGKVKHINLQPYELHKLICASSTKRKISERQMKFAELLFNEEELVPVSETKKKIEKFYLSINKKKTQNLLDEIKNLKLGKSVCLSGIRNELIKAFPMNFIGHLSVLFNQIIFEKKVPMAWKCHRIKLIRKEMKSYRLIALIEETRKFFEKCIQRKLSFRLSTRQTGFRERHSLIDNALGVDHLFRKGAGELICVSLDIKASRGIPQGSVLSPNLYNVFIDDLLLYIPQGLRKNLFIYADDIFLVGTTYELNQQKCFYNANKRCQIVVNGSPIEKQSPMHYLGYYFNLKGTDTNSSIKETRKKSLKAAIIMKNGLIKKVGVGNSEYYRLLLKGYVTFIRPHLDHTISLLDANKTYNTYGKYAYITRIIPMKLLKDLKNDFLIDNITLLKQITSLGFYDLNNIRYNDFKRLLNIIKEEKFIHIQDIVAFFYCPKPKSSYGMLLLSHTNLNTI
ncbi:reverse transcriptase, partial [Hamiltosporidium tvaerminnensis]